MQPYPIDSLNLNFGQIAPALTTLDEKITLELPTYREIAPLKQNFGQGDRPLIT